MDSIDPRTFGCTTCGDHVIGVLDPLKGKYDYLHFAPWGHHHNAMPYLIDEETPDDPYATQAAYMADRYSA